MRKVCIVTGASRGIGRATALRLAEDGFDTVVNYHRSEEEARRVAEEVAERGREGLALRADVAEPREVDAMVAGTVEAFGGVDALVNNAGVYRRGSLEALPLKQWRRILDVNLTGAFLCIQAVVPHLKARGQGRIVNVSSQIAVRGTDHGADYAASKAGLLGLTKAAALELGPHITVNAVAPGTIETDLIADYTEEDRRRKHASLPLGRIGLPQEVASAVSFLVSPDAEYVTGATLHVNGGGLIV